VIALENKNKIHSLDNPNFSIVSLTDLLNDNNHLIENSDAVIHLAAKTHSSTKDNKKNIAEYKKINVELTRTICSLSIKHNIKKIIYLSSIKVNGEYSSKHGFNEEDKPRPTDIYGISKLEAENLIKYLCVGKATKYFIIRSPLVYGSRYKGNISLLIKIIKLGLPLPLKNIKNKRSFIYIENLNSAILSCLKDKKVINQTYLISDDGSLSTPNLMIAIASAMKKKIIIFSFPIYLLSFLARLLKQTSKFDKLNNNLVVNNDKFKKDFKWSPPYTISEGIKKSFSRN